MIDHLCFEGFKDEVQCKIDGQIFKSFVIMLDWAFIPKAGLYAVCKPVFEFEI